jgi:hypothetical protein
MFDTIPIHTSALRYAIHEGEAGEEAMAILFDRSPTLQKTGSGSGDPFGIYVVRGIDAKGGGGARITVSVVLSLSGPFTQSLHTDMMDAAASGSFAVEALRRRDWPAILDLLLQNKWTGLDHRRALFSSEIVWNAERIVQGALVSLGAMDGEQSKQRQSVVIEVERPVGWVVSAEERLERQVDLREMEVVVERHSTSTRGELVASLFDAIWAAVLSMRRGESDEIPPEDDDSSPGFSDLLEAGALDPTSSLPRFQRLNGHLLRLDRLHVATSAGVGDEADADLTESEAPPTISAAAEEQGVYLSLQTRANIAERPASSRFDALVDTEIVDGLTLDMVFGDGVDGADGDDEILDRLRDAMVNKFAGFVSSRDVFANERAFDFYNEDSQERAKRTLRQAFDDGVSFRDVVYVWRQKQISLLEELDVRRAAFEKWVVDVCERSSIANNAFVLRFHISVLLAQSMLLQTLGAGAAPRLRVTQPRLAPAVEAACALQRSIVESAKSVLLDRVLNACTSCEEKKIKWLSLGELVQLLGYATQHVLMNDGSGGGDGGGGGDDDGSGDDGIRYPVQLSGTESPTAPFLATAGTAISNVAIDRPVYGFGPLIAALGSLRPTVLIPFTTDDMLKSEIGATILKAFRTGTIPALRPWKDPFPVSMMRPWSPARMGSRFLVRDALQAVMCASYRTLVSTTDSGVLRFLSRAFLSIRLDGTLSAIEVSDAVDVDELVTRCGVYDIGTLQHDLCLLLTRLKFPVGEDDGAFRPRRDNGDRLELQLSDLEDVLSRHSLNDVQEALDSLFGLVDGHEGGKWLVDDEMKAMSRSLPSIQDVEDMITARRVATTLIGQITLTTGIRAMLVFSFVVYMIHQVSLVVTMDGVDVVATSESLITTSGGRGASDDDVAQRASRLLSELFVRFTPFESPDRLDRGLFQDQLRFILTGVLRAAVQPDTSPPSRALGEGSGGNDIVFTVTDDTWSDWMSGMTTFAAETVAGAALDVVEWYVLGELG